MWSLLQVCHVLCVFQVDEEGNQTSEAVYVPSDNCDTNFSLTVPVTPEYKYIFQVTGLWNAFLR